MRRIALCAVAIGLVAAAAGMLPAPAGAQADAAAATRLREELARLQQNPATPGRAIYRVACATCHGFNGNGFGPGAPGFAQRATDFTNGRYLLRSTTGRVPAPGDLERTIRVGMPGTEMVPFKDLLSERSIQAVAEYIKGFSPELVAADPKEGQVVEIPEKRPFERTAETIAEGAQLYESLGCADCHGPEGRGTNDETDDWEYPVVMLSFQEGYYKSGTRDQDLYRSIATGMQGTTMEAYVDEASAEDLWKVVDFIRSLARDRGFAGRSMDFLFRDRPSGFDYSTY